MYCKNCGKELNDNQAVCLSCGVAVGTGNNFCHSCGSPIDEDARFCTNCGAAQSKQEQEPKQNDTVVIPTSNTAGIAKRSVLTAIILSLITCGIYGIYWFVCLTNEMNKASGRENDTNGGTAFLLSLVTCGIYTYVWAYKMGEKRDALNNENASSNILYLLLTLFGFGIVVYALAQDAINKAIDRA